ncbi:DUF1217 domain-containing protein [Shimia sp. NS0008-38b]|uniref:DUF1217 domain-containing protein n=1 Tax=Shimia sp. NS0008-38b TaxID=3127653 RepID=UPI00310BD727
MTYQPIVAGSGLVAWNFLQRTMDTQTQAFEASPEISRDLDYFAENIGNVETAEDLTSDRRLMTVVLGAYGLDDDINNTFFMNKILSEGSQADDALANRLADKRYLKLAEDFGFGDIGGPWHKVPGFVEDVQENFTTRQFEIAVGNQDDSLRLAMNAVRELEEIATSGSSDNAMWYTVMGSPPLRSVMETTFNLPSSFGTLDIDLQLETFRDRMEGITGDGEVSQFANEEVRDQIVQRYLLMSQISNTQTYSSNQIALTLLSY